MKLFTLVADLELSTIGFYNEVNRATASGKTMAQRLGADAESIKGAFNDAFSFTIGQLMADAVQVGLREMVEFTKESLEAASAMTEIKNVIDTLFGDDADVIYRWARGAKEAFGMSERDALEYVSAMAPVLDSLGFTAEESMSMAMDYIARTGDIASFRNKSFDETFTKMMSGLRGETESIEDLGVTVHVSSMVDWLGLEKETDFTKNMSQQEQWAARYAFIMEKTASAEGDFVKTQDTYANQMRVLESNIEQLKATIGEGLLPVMTDLLSFVNSLFSGGENAADGINAVKDAFSESYVSIETTTTNALALVNALAELEAAGEDTAASDAWNAILSQLEQTLPEIGTLIDEETGKINGGTEALRAYVAQWRQTSMELAQQQVVQGMYDEYAAMLAEIAQLETEQKIADIMQAGATAEMDALGAQLFDTVMAGAQSIGAYEFMLKFNAQEAENMLLRIAEGGAMPLAQSDFMKAYTAAGGSYDFLEHMANLYAGQLKTYEEYDIDNSKAISDRQALLANQEQELTVLQQILTALNEKSSITVNVSATLDGDEIATAVESKIATDANNKALVAGE